MIIMENQQRSENKKFEHMKEPYDVTTPIEIFFQRIQECIDFASAAQSPLSVEQILDSTFLTLQRTGVLPRRSLLDKTWNNFRIFFKEGHSYYIEDLDLTTQQGSALWANATPTDMLGVTGAFEHLATATAADQTAVTNLINSNHALAEQLQTRNNELQASNVVNVTLQQKITKLDQEFAALRLQFQSTQANVPQVAPSQAP